MNTGSPPRPPGRPPSGGGPRKPFPRRPISPNSPLEGRQLWRIGDWGGASEQIGRRWEELGSRSLLTVLGQPRPGPDGETYVPERAIILVMEPELAAQVQAHGKSHADAILVGLLNGDVILEPVDFKWTLETADIKQVGTGVLQALLEEPPPLLDQAIRAAVAEVRPSDSEELPRLHDGIFFAPDTVANRSHLAPRGPMDPVWAALTPVSATEFFSPLVGWDVAEHLARLERSTLANVEITERYYRLGAGIRGALRKLDAGIFRAETADFNDIPALEALRQQRRLRSVGDIVSYLDRALIGRAELIQKLRETERAAYPFSRFQADLKAMGVIVKTEDRRWRILHSGVMKEVGTAIRSAGAELVQSGKTEADALTALAARNAEWTSMARERLRGSPLPTE